jgi:hypothetical protein
MSNKHSWQEWIPDLADLPEHLRRQLGIKTRPVALPECRVISGPDLMWVLLPDQMRRSVGSSFGKYPTVIQMWFTPATTRRKTNPRW